MTKKKTTYFNAITEIGIRNEKHSPKEKKRIVLFNISCFVWHAIALIQIISYFLLGYFTATTVNYTDVYIHLALMSIVLLSQTIHTKQHFKVGRILFLCCVLTIGVLFGNFLKPGRLIEFYLILVPGLSLVFFDNKLINRFFFSISLLCFTLPDAYFENYATIKLYSPGMICLFFSVYMLVNYFKTLNEKNQNLLALERDKVLSDKIILEKQEAKLRELNQFKTHFFVNFSHEIRTPITLIKGYTSKLKYGDSEQDYNEKINIVNSQTNQIENILNNILDLSKLDENKLELQRTNISITSLVNKHYADYKSLFNKKNIAFTLLNNTEDISINIDSNLFSKAISNLLNNALKFTQDFGEVNIKIYEDNDLFIQVIDNGIGIPSEDFNRVFDRFYQSENEITKSQGSGIGLSFTKSIIEAHGFDIKVNSTPNITTCFTITVPKNYLIVEKQIINITPKLTTCNTAIKPHTLLTATKKETVLIVDDHEELRYYLKTVLKEYNILEASNGIKALNIIKNNSIDIIVTDYMMPEMDGKALVKEIKKLQLKIPIIILTARVDDVAKLDMLRIGVDNYMIKPFMEEELLFSIENSLKTYKNIIDNQKNLTIEEKKDFNSFEMEFQEKIKSFIKENLTDYNFGVDNIAEYFNISRRTLNRRAKSFLGQTTKDLIMQARIEKARELQLKNPFMIQKEIAKAVGVRNTGHLFQKIAATYGKHYNN